ncbi:hypothetical protein KVV02_005621, partial [Mortierella alpina]
CSYVLFTFVTISVVCSLYNCLFPPNHPTTQPLNASKSSLLAAMENTAKPKVLIVGAGLGGLTLALLLDRMEIDYEIFERAKEIKPLGSGMSLGPNILPVFEQLGMLEEVYAISKPAHSIDMHVGDGTFIGGLNMSKHREWCVTLNTVPGNRICWAVRVMMDSQDKEAMFRNSEWGPESNEFMVTQVSHHKIPFGGTFGDLIKATPKNLISRVFLEEKCFETWNHQRTALLGDGMCSLNLCLVTHSGLNSPQHRMAQLAALSDINTTPMSAALADPKIILHVFSLLHTNDLQLSASSVCREWYILARPLLYPTGIHWLGKVPLTRQYILEDLHGIQTLPVITSISAHYYVRPIPSSDTAHVCAGDWSQLRTQIRGLIVKDPESHFQELVVSGNLDLSVEALEPLRLFSTSLTSVRLENTWMDTITVAVILESCPHLLQLKIESTFRRPAVTGASDIVQPLSADEEKGMPAGILLPDREFTTALTHLSLCGIRIQLQSLERLLFSCRNRPNSTGLLDLTLRQVMIQGPFSAPRTESVASSDQQQTLDSIHSWCPSLRSLHFSLMDTTPTQLDQAQLFKRFADVPSWGIPHSDVLPSTFLSLQAYVNNVTTLKLTCSCDGLAPLALHEYLCNSPQLRNLAIDKIQYPAEYMDLEPVAVNKAGYYSPRYCQDESSTLEAKHKSSDPRSLTLWLQRRVWACRGLETLQINVDGLVGDTRAARNSRVMFAYLALVCPHLRELRITRDKMNLQLEGGLCYLGVLEDLQILILQTKHIQVKHVSDIAWISQISASASAAAVGSRTRKTMGSITGSNRISRLDTGITLPPSSSSVNALFSSWRDALSLTPAELRPILIACTATAANCPKILVPLVHQTLAEIESSSLALPGTADTTNSINHFAKQVRFVRRLREGLLKASSLCGGPYSINALGAVNFALEPELSAAVNEYGPVRGSNNVSTPEEYQQRGRELFQTIYQHHSKRCATISYG